MADEGDKICPRCAETVKSAAVVCRFCGLDFATGSIAQTQPPAPPQQVFTSPPKNSFQSCVGCLAGGLGILIALIWFGSLDLGWLDRLFTFDAQAPISPPTQQSEQPILVQAGLDVIPILREVGPPWAEKPVFDFTEFEDAPDGLRYREVAFDQGRVIIGREGFGGIHLLKLQTGMGSECGDAAPLLKALDTLSQRIGIDRLTAFQLSNLSATLSGSQTSTEFAGSHTIVRATGGCEKTLEIEAII